MDTKFVTPCNFLRTLCRQATLIFSEIQKNILLSALGIIADDNHHILHHFNYLYPYPCHQGIKEAEWNGKAWPILSKHALVFSPHYPKDADNC